MKDEMEDLEQQLKSALGREEAPAWFEARVMSAVKNAEAPRPRPWWHLATAVAMAAVMMVGVGVEWQRRAQERAEGEAAKAKLQLALKITGTKLAQIQQRMEEARGAN